MITALTSTKVRVRIRGLEMLVFWEILRTYLVNDPYANYKMENWSFQSSAKFMRKIRKTNLIHLHVHLADTIALILRV